MGEGWKLIAGLLGVIAGLVAGFGALALVMQRTGGQFSDNPGLGLLVAVGLVGGGAALIGYLALWIVGVIEKKRKKARRASEKRRRRKK